MTRLGGMTTFSGGLLGGGLLVWIKIEIPAGGRDFWFLIFTYYFKYNSVTITHLLSIFWFVSMR